MSDVFSYKTRGNSSIDNKPRVCFTCHPDDIDRYLEEVCKDILDLSDCAIFYTEDMNAPIDDKNTLVTLERMSLFVIPVTYKLLTKPNRAKDFDLNFAKERHIPVLPLLMESGIYEFYKKPENFGDMQYLKPYGDDETKIDYKDKLRNYLESILISDELTGRIRKALGSGIDPEHTYLTGLAYLKGIGVEVDTGKGVALITHAAESGLPEAIEKLYLMYKYGDCVESDVAKTIYWAKRLYDSDIEKYGEHHPVTLYALFNLALAYGSSSADYGRANVMFLYCFGEMSKTLGEEHPDTLRAMNNLAHSFYLEREFIMSAGLHEACFKLRCKVLGEDHPETLISISDSADVYFSIKEYKKALELRELEYEIRCRYLTEEHPGTLGALYRLALSYRAMENNQKALELATDCYETSLKILGEDYWTTKQAYDLMKELQN